VRYAESARPFTTYPAQLCVYLTEHCLGEPEGRTLLDLGCGRGEFLHEFARLGFRASGVDREVQSRFPEKVAQVDLEREKLPYEDGSLQVVFNKSVLEHTREISHLLGECHRVLAPGGLLVTLVPDWKSQWSHFYDDWTHVRPFTLVGLRECITCHGFEVEEARRFRQLPLLWQWPWLRPLADLAALLPDALKGYRWVRFSKEWMLLVVARKPGGQSGGDPGKAGDSA
jgi:SAM-dependent methyltransferase